MLKMANTETRSGNKMYGLSIIPGEVYDHFLPSAPRINENILYSSVNDAWDDIVLPCIHVSRMHFVQGPSDVVNPWT